jgi:acetate kinase
MDTASKEPLVGVINAGSSSLKWSFYEGERRILSGQVEGIGTHPSANAVGANGEKITPPSLGEKPPTVPSEVLPAILPWARDRLGDRPLAAFGHRVVHGGTRYSRPARVTAELLAELEALVPLHPMGTRCGDLDAGVVLYLIEQKRMSPDEVLELLYKRSGMLGLSGISSDFRELLASDDPRARFAVELFCYRVARHIASLAAALGGLDGVVFTAGVGENAAPVRSAICRGCAWLGLELDEAANLEHRERISTPNSRIAAYVIGTDENLMIARHARALIGR